MINSYRLSIFSLMSSFQSWLVKSFPLDGQILTSLNPPQQAARVKTSPKSMPTTRTSLAFTNLLATASLSGNTSRILGSSSLRVNVCFRPLTCQRQAAGESCRSFQMFRLGRIASQNPMLALLFSLDSHAHPTCYTTIVRSQSLSDELHSYLKLCS